LDVVLWVGESVMALFEAIVDKSWDPHLRGNAVRICGHDLDMATSCGNATVPEIGDICFWIKHRHDEMIHRRAWSDWQ